MKYIKQPATTEKHYVTFWGNDYPKVFEEGSHQDQYFLSQAVKSWLVVNDIKIFVTYNCGDMGGGVPEFTLEFLSESDAMQFIEAWG